MLLSEKLWESLIESVIERQKPYYKHSIVHIPSTLILLETQHIAFLYLNKYFKQHEVRNMHLNKYFKQMAWQMFML